MLMDFEKWLFLPKLSVARGCRQTHAGGRILASEIIDEWLATAVGKGAAWGLKIKFEIRESCKNSGLSACLLDIATNWPAVCIMPGQAKAYRFLISRYLLIRVLLLTKQINSHEVAGRWSYEREDQTAGERCR
jgi:hypothetical protein